MTAAPAPLDKLGAPAQRLKRSQASLFGGIACAAAAFALTLLLFGSLGPLPIAIAVVVGGALGLWVRLADL